MPWDCVGADVARCLALGPLAWLLGALLQAPDGGTSGVYQENITKKTGPEDWRAREAATFVFGCILEGPSVGQVAQLVGMGLQFLMSATKDPSAQVRLTTMWTIGARLTSAPKPAVGLPCGRQVAHAQEGRGLWAGCREPGGAWHACPAKLPALHASASGTAERGDVSDPRADVGILAQGGSSSLCTAARKGRPSSRPPTCPPSCRCCRTASATSPTLQRRCDCWIRLCMALIVMFVSRQQRLQVEGRSKNWQPGDSFQDHRVECTGSPVTAFRITG